MHRVVVTGIGLVSALGNREATWQRLLAGQSAIRRCRPFPELPALPLARAERTLGVLPELSDRLARMALADAGLSIPQLECGVVVGSSRGTQPQWERALRERHLTGQWQLDRWPLLLPDSAARAAAIALQTKGPLLAPAAACTTGLQAIVQAFDLVRAGRCDRAIAGAVDLPIAPLTLAGFLRMGAYAKTGCYPFARRREGLVLGEGGAIVVLETAEAARKRGALPYGEILGYGLTCDAHHCSAPAPAPRAAAARAIKDALAATDCAPAAIDYIHTHGTSTPLNDATEARLLAALFAPEVAASSTKGATGHTLGASGALGVAFCLLALRDRHLPPCVGLGDDPEFPWNWLRSSQAAAVDRVLCLGFGFGGQNAAIVLGQP